ncbi:MAG: NUDIX domain-containing protein [Chloroflexi bacterium]|nr:NUDIX domain-containing protein [Chloroflexota bacterium]
MQVLNERPRLVCPRCEFIYWNNPLPVAGAAVIDERGHILLARRAVAPLRGWWNLPAGFMEWGESAEEAACREVREETGIEVLITGYLTAAGVAREEQPWASITYVFYYARPIGGRLRAGDDADDAAFFPPDALPEQIAFSSNRKALACWEEDRSRGRLIALGYASSASGP